MAKARAKPASSKKPETVAEQQAADRERRWQKHETRRKNWRAPFSGS
jgi:hypothetical protein